MMVKWMVPIAMFMALVLGGLPAAADHRDRDERKPKLERIAHKLTNATNELYREAAESRRFQRSYAHRSALRGLAALDENARRFEKRLARRGVNAYRTQAAFHELERAHAKAVVRLNRIDRRHRLHGELDRVTRLVNKLDTKIARVERRQDRRVAHRDARDRWDRRGWRGGFAWNWAY